MALQPASSSRPVAASQTRTVASPALTSVRPSGENATARTWFVWPPSTAIPVPAPGRHSRTVVDEPMARTDPSAEKASAPTGSPASGATYAWPVTASTMLTDPSFPPLASTPRVASKAVAPTSEACALNWRTGASVTASQIVTVPLLSPVTISEPSDSQASENTAAEWVVVGCGGPSPGRAAPNVFAPPRPAAGSRAPTSLA